MKKWLFALAFLFSIPLLGQNAQISGRITDPAGLGVPGARIVLRRVDTGAIREVASNQQGIYSVSALLPGSYHVSVDTIGFRTVHQTDVVVEVDQRARLDFALTIGSKEETVTVLANPSLLHTSEASVSTVIGNRFVENMPLNGRSFSSLIGLTPGVALTSASLYEQGQFTVNGQRPDANYFTVDGVSANLGNAGGGSTLLQGGSGQLPATSAFGGTSNLVSLDAMEEFRIQTSTFAPEFGRTPGAQVSVVTKSGTNAFHGTAFEYFRNDKLDANDWFANSQGLAKPKLRQNDFGGVLGGPIRENRLFFFGSYERQRVQQPRVANTYVPSLPSRQNAPAAVLPLLSAFPIPNGRDLGNGTAAFSASYSDPSSLDSYAIRMDYLPARKATVFGRYNDVPSELHQRGGGFRQTNYSSIFGTNYRTQTLTLGSNQSIASRFMNEFRFNYSRSRAHARAVLDNFAGAVVPPDSVLFPPFGSARDASFYFLGDFNPNGLRLLDGEFGNNLQQQLNVNDSFFGFLGAHQIKVGVDYRRIHSKAGLFPYQAQYVFGSLANVLADKLPQAYVISRTADVQLVLSNWSLFAQDTWKAAGNLSVTYGLRWDYNTAPSSPNGTPPFTVTQVNNLSSMALAPAGTPLWNPRKGDLAPRLGIAWQLRPSFVLRAGAGIFYDLGYSIVSNAASAFPYLQSKAILNTSFPLSSAEAAPPQFTTNSPASYLSVMDPNHVLPRTHEWNVAIEKAFGKTDIFTLTYIGAAGRKLMRVDFYNAPNPNFTGEVDIMRNGASSNYQSLQSQLRHRFAHRLQALLSYTWAHSIDSVSSDGSYANVPPGAVSSERGSSTFDIRQTFSGAISYDIPARGKGIWKSLFGSWSTDSIIYARTGPPVNVVTGQNPFGGYLSGANSVQRPNVVPDVPVWISDPNVAGRRRINKSAFSVPTGANQGNLGRNTLIGFGATQLDLALRRKFTLQERVSLQIRAEFFNIFNHPNFGPPTTYMTSPFFGQPTQTLGASLGGGGQTGGINPLYQIGGPRSIQLALKLQF